MTECPQCRQALADNARYCHSCGFSISLDKPTVPQHAVTAPTAEDPFPDRLIGSVLEGKYQILAKLGQGGMGSVYRARRVHIGDEVAVKVLLQEFVKNTAALERFRREARASAMLHHPNVVTIHDYGEANEASAPAFIVMELVAGIPLRDIIEREGALTPPRAVALMRSICAGVGAAHRNGIVHRDIKPDNIIVQPPHMDGETETVKVLDFGIAKLRDMAGSAALTQTGMVIGTPYYMSPEQCKAASLDARSDVYSLGAMMYEMLAGNPPFDAETPTGIVARHLTESPPPMRRELNVPPAIEAVIMRALSKDPNARPSDAIEFARELTGAAAQPHQAGAPAPTREAAQPVYSQPIHQTPIYSQPPAKSRKGIVAGIVIALLVIAAGAVGGVWLWNRKADRVDPGNRSIAQSNANQNTNPPVTKQKQNVQPIPNANSSPPDVTPYTPPVDAVSMKREITDALNGWAAASRAHDLGAHMSYFADVLDTYYNAKNVPSSRARADIGRAFSIYSSLDVQLANIEVTLDDEGARATAIFDKTWEFTGERRSVGSVQQMVWLEKRGGRWLITGIKDLKTYYVGK
ncbi:MAG TPA: protein kinase [Blastocatellia bacterium]